MATVRPSLPRSVSNQRPYSDQKTLRPQKEELRSRSHSRNRPARIYNADALPRYTCNESRARKPPFSPTIEDQGFGPEEVKMRGETDQKPMLIQVAGESSSAESNGPPTPESSTSDGQDAQIHDSSDYTDSDSDSDDEPISRAYTAVKSIPQPMPKAEARGRKQGLKVETEQGRRSSTGSPKQQIERARSPYTFRPQRTSRPDDKRRTAGQSSFLSPMKAPSPRVLNNRNPQKMQPQVDHVPPKQSGASEATPTNGVQVLPANASSSDRLKRPARPIFERRASAMPQLGSSTSATAARSRYVENSSDESDREKYAKLRARSGQFTSDALTTNSASYFDTPRQDERHSIKDSPPPTPLSPEHTRTFFNKESLINGPGLQHLSTVLEDQHSPVQRQASPRPSPQASPRVSPTATPYPSPPRTPPERHHQRASTVEILQKTLPTASKTSSPLSSRPSSPVPGSKTFTARQLDYDSRPPPMMSQDRRTSTWDSSNSNSSLQYDSPPTPKPDIRSASPEVRRHPDRTPSYDSDTQGRRLREASYLPGSPKETAMLDSFEPNRRHRKPSSEDLRKALPQIATKQPVLQQEGASSPMASRPKQRSGSYVPATAGPALGASLLSPGSSGHRSQSIAPEAASHRRHRSRSRAASDAKAVQRSRSSAPEQMVPSSDQRQPVLLPQCPRPEAVAGYDDWYALERNSSMLICPECRTSIFGTGWERAFRRAAEPKRNQKIHCAMNSPWIRLACLDSFKDRKVDTKLFDLLAEVSQEEPACPESRLEEDRLWYHLRDNETSRDFKDFHICSHCVYSLETIYPRLGPVFYRSKDLKKDEARVCSLRSDIHRFGKYLNAFVTMAEDAVKLPKSAVPPTSDFIWEVKWMTIISPCNGAAVHYGQDMHSHPDLPQLTICEECYYQTVRPLLKLVRTGKISSSLAATTASHFIQQINPDPKEIVGGSTCKLSSPRMKQIFEQSVREDDFEYLRKAVKKRNDLLMDLEEAKGELAKKNDEGSRKEVEYLKGKWEKLEKKHGS